MSLHDVVLRTFKTLFIFVSENICFLSELLSCKTLKFYATSIAHNIPCILRPHVSLFIWLVTKL